MITKICLLLLLFSAINPIVASRPIVAADYSTDASTTQTQNMILSGHFGGIASAVAVQGNYAYVGIGTEFAVIDISQPATPIRVAYITLGAAIARKGISLIGSYAYVTAGQLLIIDISDPLHPSLANSVAVSSPGGVALNGSYAYLTGYFAGFTGMQILDVSQPISPVQVGFYNNVDVDLAGYGQIVVSGRYAYYSAESCGEFCVEFIRIVDVLDPTHPTTAGLLYNDYWFNGTFSDFAAVGSTVYMAAAQYLKIVDVSTPPNLTTLSYYTATTPISSIAVHGNIAYLGDKNVLHTIDVSLPSQPQALGVYGLGGVLGTATLGKYGYVVNGEGFHILDIQNPSGLTSVGVYKTIGSINTLAVDGDHAYIPGAAGFHIVDISDPLDPFIVGSTYTATLGSGEVVVAGEYAYVLGSSVLHVIDVSNPTAPSPIGFYAPSPATALFTDIAISDTYAFLGSTSALRILDISDPSHLAETNVISDGSYSLAISGNYLYALYDSQLRITDITHPTQPALTSNYSFSYAHWGIAVAEGYAYSTDPWTSGSIDIVDVRNPASPIHASYYQNYARFITIVNQYIYLTGQDIDFIQVLNVTTPDFPQMIGGYDLPSGCQDVGVANSYIYVACGSNGLYILKLLTPQAYLPFLTD